MRTRRCASSSRCPADGRPRSASPDEFARHGGFSAPHRDGWGIAWYDGRDVKIVREPVAAASSVCVDFIQRYPFSSSLVVSHVRHATQGELALCNTQPFTRELGGRVHVFAHNGDLAGIRANAALTPRSFRPVGETDSEHAFCVLLDWLREIWGAATPPAPAARREVIAEFATTMRRLGPANFVYSDGELLFLHGDRRKHEPGAAPRPPGLHVLCRACEDATTSFETAGLGVSAVQQDVVLAASVPLTTEAWQPLGEGEIVVARAGTKL